LKKVGSINFRTKCVKDYKVPDWLTNTIKAIYEHPLYVAAKKGSFLDVKDVPIDVVKNVLNMTTDDEVRHFKTGKLLTNDEFDTAKLITLLALFDHKRTKSIHEVAGSTRDEWTFGVDYDPDVMEEKPTCRRVTTALKQSRTAACNRRREHAEAMCPCFECPASVWRESENEVDWTPKCSQCPEAHLRHMVIKAGMHDRAVMSKLIKGNFATSGVTNVGRPYAMNLVRSLFGAAGLENPQELALWHLRKVNVSKLHRILGLSFDTISMLTYHKLGGITRVHYWFLLFHELYDWLMVYTNHII
jgi:hypothetical protein